MVDAGMQDDLLERDVLGDDVMEVVVDVVRVLGEPECGMGLGVNVDEQGAVTLLS